MPGASDADILHQSVFVFYSANEIMSPTTTYCCIEKKTNNGKKSSASTNEHAACVPPNKTHLSSQGHAQFHCADTNTEEKEAHTRSSEGGENDRQRVTEGRDTQRGKTKAGRKPLPYYRVGIQISLSS